MILISRDETQFTLHTAHTTYQMRVDEWGRLQHCYYGPRAEGDLSGNFKTDLHPSFGVRPAEIPFGVDYSLNALPMEYSTYGVGDYRQSSLIPSHFDGSRAFDPKYLDYRLIDGKYPTPGMPSFHDPQGETIEITLEDKHTGLTVVLIYGVLAEQDCITRSVRVENRGGQAVWLEKVMSLTLSFRDHQWDCCHFYGSWSDERRLCREPLRPGTLSFGSTAGISSNRSNPAFMLCSPEASETAGKVYGFAFVYSGNFLTECEVDPLGTTRVNVGIHPENFRWKLAPGEAFSAPEVAMVFTEGGFSEMSHRFHDLIRRDLCIHPVKWESRPVLINNWEGTMFDFTGERIVEIARSGVQMGCDLFVLDDGWFGIRDNDRSGLGDWVENKMKLGGSLKQLIEKVRALGYRFGLWFEPEMVSEDSDLYRAHPEWAMHIPERKPSYSRKQLVLNLGRSDVQDFLIQMLNHYLSRYKIDYVKWDCNRFLSDLYDDTLPFDRQGEVSHRYVLGLYRVLETVTAAFPNVIFEGCSGGGARFDCGMLYYEPQIWTSDNTDCLDRLKIQGGTSYFYPSSAMGAHVSALKSRQNRPAPLHTRAVVAMNGTFGFELDSTKLTEEDKEICKAESEFFRKVQPLIFEGDFDRLTDPFGDSPVQAWQHTAKDRSEALVSAVLLRNRGPGKAFYVCPRGLLPKERYSVNGGEPVQGKALMEMGFAISLNQPDLTAIRFLIQKV